MFCAAVWYAVCLFLALKINESREAPVSRSLQAIQRRFEVSSKSILDQEFSVFAELDFSLWVPRREFMPHFLRMFEVLGKYPRPYGYLMLIKWSKVNTFICLLMPVCLDTSTNTNYYASFIGLYRSLADYLGDSDFFA
ncbi:hypothetical protein BX661DRAFT_14189 [Kickxella alabastrina]|uniref:uncharacterized protein n=1 Tax=Kickxella alabastrina TaxID=61397 RepID=UPI00222114DE|nr:uncharacterized protein BX661DRAFT_14189 [Kickxella alabastrina]KAI7828427.1 hypothetical protein BX661DRAFT_14189 [Kickxella alabastrina]